MNGDDALKHKLALMAFGVIVGAGSYQVAKTLMNPRKTAKQKKEEEEK